MQKNFGIRLKTQLIAAFMAIITVLMVSVGIFTYKRVEVVLQQQSSDITHQYFKQNEHNLFSYAKEADKVLKLLTQISGLENYLDTGWRSEVDAILDANDIFNATTQIMNNYEYMESVFFYGEKGVVLGVTPTQNIVVQTQDKSQFYYESEIYQKVKENPWRTYWFGTYSAEDFNLVSNIEENKQYITIARSLNVKGKHFATVIMNINKTVLAEMIAYADEKQTIENFLIDENGIIVVHRNEASFGCNYLLAGELTDETQSYYMNQEMQVNYHKLMEGAGMPWTLVSEVPLAVLYQDIYSLRQWFIIAVVIAWIAAFLLSFYWLYRLTRPLDELRLAMKQMEKGRLGWQLEENSRNELGMLGHQFDKMSHSIEELVEQIQAVENEKRVLEKETLQAQINPHFLFNTLSNIKYMAMIIKSDTIVECITALGNFLAPIYKSKARLWTVEEEISYVQNYVTIMNYRFGGNIHTKYQYEPEVGTLYILRFILQPLVENAIQHGFEEREGRGNIIIHFYVEGEQLIVCVKDNGKGLLEEELKAIREKLNQAEASERESGVHIGLMNVHRRLKVYFGEKHGVRIESRGGEGTQIYVSFSLTDSMSENL